MASVEMIRFSYSNKDIKDEGEEEGLMAAWAHRLGATPRVKPATTLNTWPHLAVTWNRAITVGELPRDPTTLYRQPSSKD